MPRKSTRNAQGGGSIRQRADGTWEARYTVGRDPGTGKSIRKSVYAKTQKEVRMKLAQAVAAIDNADYFEPSKMTLAQWLDTWTAEYMGDKKYLTIKHYKAQVEAHIKPALGAVKLSQLQPHTIQRFYNSLLESGKQIMHGGKAVSEGAPLSAKSVRNIHGILTKALSTAVSVGYLRDNPADKVTLPRVEKKEIHPLTDGQVKAYLQAVTGDEYEILLKVILFTGLRESEAIGLTWDCIDFQVGTAKVCKQLQKRPIEDGGFVFAPLKNDKVRVIKAAPTVMSLLKRRRLDQATHRLQAGEAWQGWSTPKEQETALVFTTPLGMHLSPQTVYLHHKRLAAKIGAPESRLHDLRHPNVKPTTKTFSSFLEIYRGPTLRPYIERFFIFRQSPEA